MKVYDNSASAWKEVTSVGDFKYLFLCPAGGSGAPTLNGNIATYDLRESSNSGSAASVTSAAQLLVSVNGVVQKANTGTSAPSEGFALVDSNTIIFGANLQSGDSVFIVQIGSAVTINSPGDGTVSEAKITSGAVTQTKIGDQAVNEAKLQVSNSPTNGYFLSAQSGNTGGLTWAQVNTDLSNDSSPQLGGDLASNGNDILFADSTSSDNRLRFGAGNDLQIYHTGTVSRIQDVGTGGLEITSDGTGVDINKGTSEYMARFITDGAVELYHNNVKKIETTSAGATVTGALTATSFSGDGSNLTGVSSIGGSTGADFNDDTKLRFGGSNQLEVFYGSSKGQIEVTSGQLELISSGNFTAKVSGDETAIHCQTDAQVELYHNDTKKFQTTATGAAIYNTTSPQTSASSSANELVVSGDGATGITIHTDSTTGSNNIYFSDPDLAYAGAITYLHQHNQIRFYVNNNYSSPAMQWNSDLTIFFNGNMYSNGNSYSTGSDLRMKSNLVQFTNTLNDLKQITGYKFDITCGGGDKTRKSAGLIAQDVEKVYPDFVDTNPETGMKSLEYNTFIGVLVEAVKELTTKVETLETKVAALEAAN